jgi:hypothetical protein
LANQNNYYLVFFILEILNNLIQYQFDGNCNMVYTIIRKRNVFFNLLNLPVDQVSIDNVFDKQSKKSVEKIKADVSKSMEGSIPAKEAEPGTLKTTLAETPSVLNMTEKTLSTMEKDGDILGENSNGRNQVINNLEQASSSSFSSPKQAVNDSTLSDSNSESSSKEAQSDFSPRSAKNAVWKPTSDWVNGWKSKLPLQTIMRLLQVLVPQVEKICIDKGLTDESEILKFLQNGTLVGLLPVPHPILIRKYQPNLGTIMWFRTYMWGVIYLRNLDPPIWYDTDVKLFEIQRVQ